MRGRFPRALALLGVLLLGCDPQQHQYRVAMQQLFHRDYRAATLTLTSLAQNGHAPSQFRLGTLYRLGLGVPRNARLAIFWFEKAARQDDVGGQYWLAEVPALGRAGLRPGAIPGRPGLRGRSRRRPGQPGGGELAGTRRDRRPPRLRALADPSVSER